MRRGLELSRQDFGVHDGSRTIVEQRGMVESGASQTMRSRHLAQPADGLGKAVDLVPYVGGKLRWEWLPIYEIARAMKRAAEELETAVRWGGCWMLLAAVEDPEEAVQAYILERARRGRKAFADGPHFELPA